MTTSNEHNNAPAVPQGWRLVPIEPTREMLMAALDVENASYDNHQHVLTEQWKDMLAAALVKNDYCTWLPIESVPKNGSQIILRKGDRIGAAMWVIWPATPEHEYGEGWTVGFDGNTWDGPNAPTHWTPLPHAGNAATTAPAPAQCVPYTTIDLGHGKWEVGAGHNGGLPCIAFGRNGTGNVGEIITTAPRQMSVEETFSVITFANVTGLDVLQEKMDQVREEFFPGTTPQFAATTAPAPAQDEPFGYFRAEPFGWTDCAKDDEGAIALYERPQEVGLTDEEIEAIAQKHMSTVGDHWCNEEAIRERHAEDFARAIIAALRAKGGK